MKLAVLLYGNALFLGRKIPHCWDVNRTTPNIHSPVGRDLPTLFFTANFIGMFGSSVGFRYHQLSPLNPITHDRLCI